MSPRATRANHTRQRIWVDCDAKIQPGCFERIGHTIDRVQLIGELMKLDHRFANPPDGTGVHEVTNHRVLRTLDVQLEEIDRGGNHISSRWRTPASAV